ncbi:hypothetical protein ANCDUO_01808 [Ancylostoma duodenale]|uniref:Uncharacterized protein n=1 Tax=Ancylostoma duodenale TaxID=51022 RepID=A0A0C2HEA8_9BILA|nr:hypothetical protein ANCDUO_01808 [Ancylostoma duodenale]
MLACALCIANPQACPNPEWYTNLCLHLHAGISSHCRDAGPCRPHHAPGWGFLLFRIQKRFPEKELTSYCLGH